MNRTPDFIIIGGMKCMTSTLHEQLAAQQGFCMSNPKEPFYFSDDAVYQRGPQWYASIWEDPAPGDLCGESSTHYSKLPTYPDTVQRMVDAVADVKLIYVMRHPIDRLVSQYVHEWSMGLVTDPIDRAIETLPILVEYSRYAMQLQPYLNAFPRQNLLPVFFDRLRKHPQSELERIGRFLGSDQVPIWQPELGAQNIGAQRMRTSVWRDRIAYAPGISTLRRVCVPKSVRNRVKSFWQMQKQPTLSEESITSLTKVFDTDLERLSRLLDLPETLSCATFKQTVDWDLSTVPPAETSRCSMTSEVSE
ncbi:sulfotransferase domain-containing protein [Stieleria sp. TO1_6]|uniref:sulfotransferase domain-containing protein n=1 Tax=Stieleria tagensis TaxID=2956795 RepID=UPI00209AEBF7|nr:sulfotransferase domain-containing protein [Stieleria tagensis]MCO8120675.1 sulfotransferase domain-containing protein [Stieleria tagensis]